MRFDLVLNIMTATAHTRKEVKVFGGNQWRPLLDVRDAARAFCMFLEVPEVPHSVWNVGSDIQNITINQLGRLVSNQITCSKLTIIPEQEDSRSYKVDFTRIGELLEPSISLVLSIRDVQGMFEDGSVKDHTLPIYYNSKHEYH